MTTHSQTVSTRRKKEKARKLLARTTKLAKKAGKETVKKGAKNTRKTGAA